MKYYHFKNAGWRTYPKYGRIQIEARNSLTSPWHWVQSQPTQECADNVIKQTIKWLEL